MPTGQSLAPGRRHPPGDDPYEGTRARMNGSAAQLNRTARWLMRRAKAARSITSDGPARQAALVVAMLLFATLAVVSLRASNLEAADLDWRILAPTALLGPLVTIGLNASEFRMQGRVVGVHIDRGLAARTSVLASAANLLPIPGAVLVRLTALTAKGVSRADAMWATGLVAQIWAATSALVAAAGFAANGAPLVGGGALLLAFVFAVSAGVTQRRRLPDARVRHFTGIVTVELGIVFVGAARLYLTFVGFGLDVSIGQVAALTVSSVIASAAGVFPGGLGLREGLIGVAGGIVGVDLASTVIVASFDRGTSLLVLGGCAGVLLASDKLRPPSPSAATTAPSARMDPDESN